MKASVFSEMQWKLQRVCLQIIFPFSRFLLPCEEESSLDALCLQVPVLPPSGLVLH